MRHTTAQVTEQFFWTGLFCPGWVVRGLMLGSVAVTLGCQDSTSPPFVASIARQYRSLTLNHHAITLALLAPYNTLQLTVTPRQADGTSLVASGTVVWTSSDTSVQVDSTGRLTAIAPATAVTITAQMTIGGVHGATLTDHALVNVNDVSPVPTVAALTVVTQPGDSARFTADGFDDAGNYPYTVVSVLDVQGDSIPNALVEEWSSDSSKAYDSNFLGLSLIAAGQAWLHYEATTYGVTRSDSVRYTVTPHRHSFVYVYPRTPRGSTVPLGDFSPLDDTIQAGGNVVWLNTVAGQLADVVFDTPPGAVTAVAPPDSAFYINFRAWQLPSGGSGNIPAFAACDSVCHYDQQNFIQGDTNGFRGRSFPVAGTYPYHSAFYHTTGVIHVVP